MAVIKRVDYISGCFYNGEWSSETTVEDAINIIKARRERMGLWPEEEYIGESGVVDIDINKVKCKYCKERMQEYMQIELKAEREG